MWIRHVDKTHTRIIDSIYAHVTPAVTAGQVVTENTVIGTVVNYSTVTSTWTAPHLHFEIVIHDCANPDNGWEAAELSGYDSNVYTWHTGHTVNPLDFITCDEFCCEEDEISIAAAPPPAQNPPLEPLPLPYWRPVPRWPFSPDASSSQYSLISGAGGSYPSWLAYIETNVNGTITIYPFLDSPTGKIFVGGVVNGANYKEVWLWHHSRLMTWYRWWGDSRTLAVSTGEWIDMGTALGTMTRSAGVETAEWGVYMRATGAFTPTTNPEPTRADYSLHPACFLWPESGWIDWPPAAYKALSAANKCLGYGLGGLA